MASEIKALRLRITVENEDSNGEIHKRTRSFSNLDLNAADDNCYSAGSALAGLMDGSLEGIYKVREEKLTADV